MRLLIPFAGLGVFGIMCAWILRFAEHVAAFPILP